jgi:hypothetical protein
VPSRDKPCRTIAFAVGALHAPIRVWLCRTVAAANVFAFDLVSDPGAQPAQHRDQPPPGLERAGPSAAFHRGGDQDPETVRRIGPPELTPYVDGWLQVHRPLAQTFARVQGGADSASNHLWLDRWGQPTSSRAIRRQIGARTEHAFGKPVWPHLFRHCAASELVDSAPDEIAIAPDLLCHADLETTQRYYLLAEGMTAHLRVQEVIAARRRAAAARGESGA